MGWAIVGALVTLVLVGRGPLPGGEIKEPKFVLAWVKKGLRKETRRANSTLPSASPSARRMKSTSPI
jgi:hypothetical protein